MSKELGKTISIVVLVFLYCVIWGWVIDHSIDCNRNAEWEVNLSRIFIAIHVIGLLCIFVYCWT